MVDGVLFDKIARIACLIRKTTKPFGGIQVCHPKPSSDLFAWVTLYF